MSVELPPWVARCMSSARMRPYLDAAGGSLTTALDLYRWNMEASAAFQPVLHLFEVALRNAVHHELGAHFGRAAWWECAPLEKISRQKVDEAVDKCRRRPTGGQAADDIVTELSFGFWVGLLAKRYDQTLWVPAVHRAFVGYRGSRWQMEDGVRSILLFRNRIAHHEHIHTRDLRADHAKIHRLLGCLSPEFVRWWEPSDRVDEVLGRKPPLGGGTT